MSRVTLANLRPQPGERIRGWVRIPEIEPAWEIPAVAIRGSRPGPTLAITAGMHACEYVPIEALTRLTRELDAAQLRGTVLAVLLVNAPGFYERSVYVNPRDGRNLNRSFPGSSHGSPAERVAAFLLEELITGADAYLDAHCGDLIEALSPFTLWLRSADPSVAAQARALAAAYGFPHTLGVLPETVPGAAYASASERGIPAIIAEVGQQGICDEPSVERHLAGMRNLLAHLGMVDEAGSPPEPPLEMDQMIWTRTDISATYHPRVAVGQVVQAGEVVGELRDIFGDPLQTVRTQVSGIVVFLVTTLAVKVGDPLLGIGVPAS
ncbi:MAG: succinylglutamate desuccinylase/aspartoacylase family protein [Candidatus Dormibacteria bacterium]